MTLFALVLFACSDFTGISGPGDASGSGRLADCDSNPLAAEGAFARWGAPVSGSREACQAAFHATGGPAGAVLEVHLAGWSEGTARIEQRDWNGELLASVGGLASGDRATIVVPWSGEHALVVLPEGGDAGGDYALDVTCVEGCSGEWSRHPILLMHGMGGLIPNYGRFYEVAETLDDAGYRVFDPSVDPFQRAAVRASVWRQHLDAWRTHGTWRRVHLMGHSMGGIDARYLASQLDPEGQIVSVTTYGTPHHGSEIADLILGVFPDASLHGETLEAVAAWLGQYHDGATTDQDLRAQLVNLSSTGMELFNAEVPDRADVQYRSWAGVTCSLLDFTCQNAWGTEVVDWQLQVPLLAMNAMTGPSDGVVTVSSAAWGDFQGVLAADHFDLHGQANTGDSFDHYAFFVDEARRLAALERGDSGPVELQAYSVEDVADYEALIAD